MHYENLCKLDQLLKYNCIALMCLVYQMFHFVLIRNTLCKESSQQPPKKRKSHHSWFNYNNTTGKKKGSRRGAILLLIFASWISKKQLLRSENVPVCW